MQIHMLTVMGQAGAARILTNPTAAAIAKNGLKAIMLVFSCP